jgi:dihydrofolate synthase/folylpolyglutamate synthase
LTLTDPAERSLDAALARVQSLHPRIIDLSLGRIERLLAALGHPERALPPVLHIAGTNGKGSVLAFLRAMLDAAGYSVHLYTSPHLVRFNERIVVAGEEIGDGDLLSLLGECEAANKGEAITFFEFTTAAAYLAFARAPADILLLETGLGGRLDATNVIDRPVLTAITPVSLDHQGFLGDDLGGIAAEKAGILKPGVTGVVSAQPEPAMAAIAARAAKIGAPLIREGDDWRVDETKDGLRFSGRSGTLALPRPNLAGAHQMANAGMALACLDALDGFPVDDAAKARGITSARWPARLQRLTDGPLAAALPDGWELWLDGGHNPAAAQVLADWADGLSDGRPLHLISAFLETKDAEAFLQIIALKAASLHALAPDGEHAYIPAETLAGFGRALGLASTTAADVPAALEDLAGHKGPARVLICGSLYLAGEVLAQSR